MSQAVATQNSAANLTGLLVPLADRTLLLPNVAVAELIPYRAPQVSEGAPAWFLGQIAWRDLSLPLFSFEAASGGQAQVASGARVAVINALGGRPKVKFIALLVQGIPRSLKVGSDLAAADVELAPLELGAARIADEVVRIPDLVALEQMLDDAGLI
ncbi:MULTISPECIES: chemotaxis protein CheW [Pseudomonas]|jgi:chemosensory pili system protein ChpC|uniref:Chemotaxis protein CheW n=1 Tax=Ectopseudomonas khazarica TaxID=2502979 RepID=A0ABW7MDQ4_9GAMM|nr:MULTISPECIES: chemotaxis protein CheW [Pseudomonas]HIQ44685.1 chemotaxis protein CheW [Pseudomonas oleovorans]QFT20364.1 CheW-like domain protein [Pseudomonas sp. THAF187a]QFT40555.1 CheW-like domain protein [Pseudomonas sp. THAF42]QTS86959.1 chemotaxis protein CheW [Pseudomonas khazarica]WFC60767.1 chemotaxis protein CheW [Pseudomonas sp. REST10]|tara:strand:+ start:522 stop:992 length:471 start_codon:yes stop_codon:yes gene_type:complete